LFFWQKYLFDGRIWFGLERVEPLFCHAIVYKGRFQMDNTDLLGHVEILLANMKIGVKVENDIFVVVWLELHLCLYCSAAENCL
jgi:hypothetical protein